MATFKAIRSSLRIYDTISKIQNKLIKTFQYQNFDKLICKADKDNNFFFYEVSLLPCTLGQQQLLLFYVHEHVTCKVFICALGG